MSLAEDYERLCRTPSDIYQHLPTLVEMVHELHASHVIELGTRTGVSTVAFLHALRATEGRLTSVDIDERPDIGEHERWEFVQGDDLDPDVVEQLDEADIVFIDTSHLYEQTRRELNTYRWLVRPGGLMVLHDTELFRPETAQVGEPPFPVRKAIDEFIAETGFAFKNFTGCNGLGVIQIEG